MSRRTAQSSGVEIIYRPRADNTAEAERDTLANVFRFILFESSAGKKEAVEPAPELDGRKDGTKAKGDSACVCILPEAP
jgi:hypothetical protein